MKNQDTYLRFTGNERLQHGLVIVAFLLLFLSGFALKYSPSEPAGWLIRLLGGMENRSAIHRFGAILLIATGLYHLAYMWLTTRGRSQWAAILLRGEDFRNVKDGWLNLFRKDKVYRPQGRYTTRQKFQYWLVLGGSLSMGATGLCMWFHDTTMALFSKAFLDIMMILHSQEAMLVFLVILLWHGYDIHFRDSFPMDWSWINGRMTLDRLKKNHPLEYEAVMKENKDA